MAQNQYFHFVVIDDDPINNIICSTLIKSSLPDVQVVTFTIPEQGLEHLSTALPNNTNTVLFLDINMPSLTGWEVLERIKVLPNSIKSQMKIFMLSSSVDPTDKERADNNPLVSGYVSKSLSLEKLRILFPGIFE